MATCRACGSWLERVRAQTMDSPAEYECPCCDHGLPLEAPEMWDEETIADVRYHEMRENPEPNR